MALAVGSRLGPYEIQAPLGAGGMGEVYRARDTKLQRDVALKVLPEAFAQSPERLARFEREAKVLASLNHPHIAQIYGLEGRALVMELVEGANLAGPLPLETALKYALQIAEALEAAHEKSVVHRDLKPANIKVTPQGIVKVLDFGLAAVMQAPAGGGDPVNSPTLTMGATQMGVILGTAAYMSPEQARGETVDKRADIWAYGVVLYEMLTGKRLFEGKTVSDTLAAVIMKEPDLSAIPAKARRLVRACLERDPKRRLRDIGEAWRLLEEPPPSETAVSARRRPAWALAAVTAFSVVTASTIAFLHFREARPVQRIVRFQTPAPEKSVPVMFHLSPDGRYLALASIEDGGTSRLWVRALDSIQAQALAGTEGARYPFWSPDGASIGFFAQGKLKRIALAGGPVQTLCPAANGRGGTWNREGVIVFSPGPNGLLQRVPAGGGVPSPLTQYGDSETSARFPEFLPDGRHFLYLATNNQPAKAGIYVGSLDGTAPVRVSSAAASNAVYAPPATPGGSGFLLFRREDTLMVQPFDLDKLRTTGELQAVADPVGEAGNSGFGAFSTSAAGLLAYGSGGLANGADRELVWVDRKGKRLETVTKPGPMDLFALSPDAKRAILTPRLKDQNDLWLQDLGRATRSRFTFGLESATGGIWSPDGSRIAFAGSAASSFSYDLFQKPASGAGKEELLAHVGVNAFASDWAADGKSIVYEALAEKTQYDLWLLPLNGGGAKPAVYLQTPFNERAAQFSPDGRWMAYESDESGQYEVYVQTIPASGAKWQVSTAGGRQPRWRRDGKEMYYVENQKLVAVNVRAAAGEFEAGKPEPLFEGIRIADFTTAYQAAPDGQRFMVGFTAAGEGGNAPPVTVVLNWQAGLQK